MEELSFIDALSMSLTYSDVLCAGDGVPHYLTELEVYEGRTLCKCCEEE